MAVLDPELAELIKALARAAVSRDRAQRTKSRRAFSPIEDDEPKPSRSDGEGNANTDIRKV
jgi:hypothetical protein